MRRQLAIVSIGMCIVDDICPIQMVGRELRKIKTPINTTHNHEVVRTGSAHSIEQRLHTYSLVAVTHMVMT